MTYFADLSFRFIHKCTRTRGALKNHTLIMTNLIENHNCFQTKTAQKPYLQGSGTEMGNTGESFFKSGERLGSRVSFICRYWIALDGLG